MAAGTCEEIPISISGMPQDLLDQIDRLAASETRSRSAQAIVLLREIVAEKLKKKGNK